MIFSSYAISAEDLFSVFFFSAAVELSSLVLRNVWPASVFENDAQVTGTPFDGSDQFSEDLHGGAVFRVAGKPPLEYRRSRLHVSLN